MSGYVGVDLDGTLAKYEGWRGAEHIGPPVPAMRERVLKLLAAGQDVRIFTSRVADDPLGVARHHIREWCLTHLGQELPITCVKEPTMYQLWDDRVVLVERNTGRVLAHPSTETLDGLHATWEAYGEYTVPELGAEDRTGRATLYGAGYGAGFQDGHAAQQRVRDALESLLDEVTKAAYPAHGPSMALCACSICRDIDRILTATRSGPVEVPR